MQINSSQFSRAETEVFLIKAVPCRVSRNENGQHVCCRESSSEHPAATANLQIQLKEAEKLISVTEKHISGCAAEPGGSPARGAGCLQLRPAGNCLVTLLKFPRFTSNAYGYPEIALKSVHRALSLTKTAAQGMVLL